MKDLRDEIALGASDEDIAEFEKEWTILASSEFKDCPDYYGWKKIRTRAEARYAYAEAMMAARAEAGDGGVK